jgi:hypothetical protein
MSNNYAETRKPQNKNFSDVIMESPYPQGDSVIFQIFFLNQDETKSVEILETNMIDFEEIVHRLNNGESVFIKPKNQETIEHYSDADDTEDNSWYLNRC